jgi:hypothetical protein
MADYGFDENMAGESMDTLSGAEEEYPDDDSPNEDFDNGSESFDHDSSDGSTVEDNGSVEDDDSSEDDIPVQDPIQDNDSSEEDLDIYGSESVVTTRSQKRELTTTSQLKVA